MFVTKDYCNKCISLWYCVTGFVPFTLPFDHRGLPYTSEGMTLLWCQNSQYNSYTSLEYHWKSLDLTHSKSIYFLVKLNLDLNKTSFYDYMIHHFTLKSIYIPDLDINIPISPTYLTYTLVYIRDLVINIHSWPWDKHTNLTLTSIYIPDLQFTFSL